MNQPRHMFWIAARVLALALGLTPLIHARPIGWRGPDQPNPSSLLASAFQPVIAQARRSVVRLRAQGQLLARATVVNQAGLAVTKASELTRVQPAQIQAVLPNDQSTAVRMIGQDRDSDLALLRIEGELHEMGLRPIQWAGQAKPDPAHDHDRAKPPSKPPSLQRGSWVVSVGQGRDPLAVGIVSAPSRAIAPRRVLLGVQIRPDEPGPRVERTLPEMGAAEAGIMVGDRITHVANQRTPTRKAVVDRLEGRLPGERVPIKVDRGQKTLEFDVTLAPLPPDIAGRSRRLSRMGGQVSKRARGFARVIQHDTVLSPDQVGSPLVNLDGQTIGLNIARAGRTATYALPASLVRTVIANLNPR